MLPQLPQNNSFKNRYKIQEKISEGNFGQVFKALDIKTNTQVAIKKIFVTQKTKNQKNGI